MSAYVSISPFHTDDYFLFRIRLKKSKKKKGLGFLTVLLEKSKDTMQTPDEAAVVSIM